MDTDTCECQERSALHNPVLQRVSSGLHLGVCGHLGHQRLNLLSFRPSYLRKSQLCTQREITHRPIDNTPAKYRLRADDFTPMANAELCEVWTAYTLAFAPQQVEQDVNNTKVMGLIPREDPY